MTVGYLIKENIKDAEKIYYDYDDIENGNKLYGEQFQSNIFKWYEVEPPKPISFWDTNLGILLKFVVIHLIVLIIHLFIYIATLQLIGVVLSWEDPEFRKGGGILLVLFSFPFYIIWIIVVLPKLVVSYI